MDTGSDSHIRPVDRRTRPAPRLPRARGPRRPAAPTRAPRIEPCCPPARSCCCARSSTPSPRPASPWAPRRWRPTRRSSAVRRRSATSSPCWRSRACSRTRTPRPAASRPTPATATSSTTCCRAARRAPDARPPARAPRGRRGHARGHRDAVAGHEPAGDRLRAADPDGHDPARRGPAAAAAGAHGRRDHLDRRRLQARVHLRAPGGRRPCRLGRQLPQRAARRPRARRPHVALAAARCDAREPTERAFIAASRPPSPSSRRPPRTRCTSTAPPACSPSAASDLSQLNELMEMLERRVTLLGALQQALDSRERLRAHRRRERRARAARALDRGRQLRPAAAQPRHGLA